MTGGSGVGEEWRFKETFEEEEEEVKRKIDRVRNEEIRRRCRKKLV